MKLYSGERPFGLFASKLPENMSKCNDLFAQMEEVFRADGIGDFSGLPESDAAKAKFAGLFNEFHEHLEAAKVQGFSWGMAEVCGESSPDSGAAECEPVPVSFTEEQFNALVQRYKELSDEGPEPGEGPSPAAPFDIRGYLTEIDTGHIDTQYMNENFTKWLKLPATEDEFEEALEAIGIGECDSFGIPYEEWFVSDYDTDMARAVQDALGEYPGIDELNRVGEDVPGMEIWTRA